MQSWPTSMVHTGQEMYTTTGEPSSGRGQHHSCGAGHRPVGHIVARAFTTRSLLFALCTSRQDAWALLNRLIELARQTH